jgi:hypothetical protein
VDTAGELLDTSGGVYTTANTTHTFIFDTSP